MVDVTRPLESMGNVTQEIVQPVVTGADVTHQAKAQNEAKGNSFAAIGSLIGAVSGAIQGIAGGQDGAGSELARDQGTQAGAASVSRDENGQLQIQPHASTLFGGGNLLSGIFGGGGSGGGGGSTGAYEHAAAAGALARGSIEVNNDINDLRLKNISDPEAFKAAGQSYITGLTPRVQGSGIAGALVEHAQQVAGQHYISLTNTKAANDIENGKSDIGLKIDHDTNDAYNLALKGARSAPEGSPAHTSYMQAHAAAVQGLQTLGENKSFGFTPEQINDKVHGLEVKMLDADNQGAIDATYARSGAVAAAKESEERVNSDTHISEADRLVLHAHGQARIAFNSGQFAERVSNNKEAFENLRSGVESGKISTSAALSQIDGIVKEAGQTGNHETANTALNWKLVHPFSPAATGLSPSQTEASLGVSPVGSGAINRAIIGQESGGNPNAPTSRSGAVGVGQIKPGTFQQYARPGESISNPADNAVVSRRVTDDYFSRFNGDARRVAVAYFSGPGNVAPPGSATPWKENKTDSQGKTVSSYVSDVAARLGDARGIVGPSTQTSIPDISNISTYAHKGAPLAAVNGFVVHHTGGGGTPQSVMETLNARDLGVQYVMDRGGQIFSALPEGTRGAHIQNANNASGLSNNNTLGMEIIAKNAADVTPQQKQAAAAFIAGKAQQYNFPVSHVFGHGEVNKGHKEADEGLDVANMVRSGAVAPGQPTAAGAGGFTQADYDAHPGLQSEVIRKLAADGHSRQEMATALGTSLTRVVNDNRLPELAPVLHYMQVSNDGNHDAQREEIATKYTALSALQGGVRGGDGGAAGVATAGGTGGMEDSTGVPAPAGGTRAVEALQRQADSQPDLQHQTAAIALGEVLAKTRGQLENDPSGYAESVLKIPRPAPINYADPQSVAQGLAVRGATASKIAATEPGFSPSAVSKTDLPALKVAAASGDPAQQLGVVNGLAMIPPGAVHDATFANADVRGAVVAATRSPDYRVKGAAYSLLDKEHRLNPMTFESNFKDGALSDLRAWQDKGQFQPAEKIAKDAMTADDPGTIAAKRALVEVADKNLKLLTNADIVRQVAKQSYISSVFSDRSPTSDAPAQMVGAMRHDYETAYKESFSKTNDDSAAQNFAVEALLGFRDGVDTGGGKWSVSPSNGGRLTAWAPERSPVNPPIKGSHDWIKVQADAAVAHAHGSQAAYALVPDQDTQAEITSGRPPAYRVIVQNEQGRFEPIPDFLFRPDHKAALADVQADHRRVTRRVAMDVFAR